MLDSKDLGYILDESKVRDRKIRSLDFDGLYRNTLIMISG